MKKVYLLIILIISISVVYAEDSKTDPKKDNSNKNSSPVGYNKVVWGTLLSKAKENLKGNIYYTDEKSVIITKDGDIEYNYGFFYIDPLKTGDNQDNKKTDSSSSDDKGKKEEKPDEGKFFYLSVKFPYISLDEIRNKIKKQYGDPTSENIRNNQGVSIWDSEKTIIIMWVDRYEKKPFSRRITYISKAIAKELNSYQKNIFNKRENKIIKSLIP